MACAAPQSGYRLRMTTELYELAVPAFTRGFAALSAILTKGEAFADERGIAHGELLGARLIEDMHPLTYQVQRVSDTAKGAIARLAGIEAPAMADDEASFAELHARIARTVEFVQSVSPASLNGREAAEVVIKTPGGDLNFTGIDYLRGFALPNFYFHVTTAYALLRMKGVPIGKRDYLGA